MRRARRPARRAGRRVERGGLPLRHRADGPHHARAARATTFAAVGADMADHLTLRPARPDVPGRASPTAASCACGTAATRWPRRSARCRGAAEAGGVRAVLRLARPRSTGSRCRTSSTRNYDSPLDLLRPLRRRCELVRLGGFRQLAPTVRRFFDDERLRRLFSFQSMYAGLAPYEALAALRRHHLHGHRSKACRPRRRRCTRCRARWRARPTKAGATFRYGRRGRADPARHGTTARCTACGSSPARCRRRRRGVQRRPARRLPHAAARARRAAVARRGRATRRRAVVWHRRRARDAPGRRRAPQHPLRRAAGTARSARSLDDGGRMPDPSILVTRADCVDEPSLAPDGRARRCTCSNRCRTSTARRLGDRARAASRDELASRVGALGYPVEDVEVEQLVDPLDWEAQGMERGTPFALAHRSSRPARSGPATSSAAPPAWCSPGSGTVPGRRRADGARLGTLAAERVAEWAATTPSGARDHARRVLRAVPASSTSAYGTTYYWATYAAAARQAPPRLGAVRVLPLRRRHRRRARRPPRSTCARRRWPTSATGSSPTSTPATPTTRCSRRSSTRSRRSASIPAASAGSSAR